jgi:transketolase
MRKQTIAYTLCIFIGLLMINSCSQLEPVVEKAKPVLEKVKKAVSSKSTGSTPGMQITTEQMAQAIKEALSQGVNDSIYLLGALEGFNLSDLYHIPIPEKLNKPAELLRKLGQGKKVDEFELRLNRSAQQAVKQSTDIFTSAIQQMSVKDALNILQGADNAATTYFRQRTESSLRERFMPIISKATDQTGLTSTYKTLDQSINKIYPDNTYTIDIDNYVMDHAMGALFDSIAVEEKLIRQQPVKRTTELMKTVFGHFQK